MRRSMAVLENLLSAVPGVTTMALLASRTYMASADFFLVLVLPLEVMVVVGELSGWLRGLGELPPPAPVPRREAESKEKSEPGASTPERGVLTP